MPILRCGNTIRLIGIEASSFKIDTGRQQLPTTVQEYNRVMLELKQIWLSYNTPESRLIAATCFQELELLEQKY